MSDVVRILLGQLRDHDADLIRLLKAYEQREARDERGLKQF